MLTSLAEAMNPRFHLGFKGHAEDGSTLNSMSGSHGEQIGGPGQWYAERACTLKTSLQVAARQQSERVDVAHVAEAREMVAL